MRTTKVDFQWNLLNLLALFPTVAADVTRANIRYASFARESRPRWYADRRLETFVTWGLKIALLLVDWKKALLFVFVPHLGAVWGVTTVNYLWHDGCDTDHEFNHSRNFVGKFFNWFHFNAGFHGMHHLEPGLHWSLLPERHYEVISPHVHKALELPSFTLYMLKTFVFQPRRLRFDGQPVVMPQEGPDEDWITAASDARPMAMAAAE
jgi:fatty acid desaturase